MLQHRDTVAPEIRMLFLFLFCNLPAIDYSVHVFGRAFPFVPLYALLGVSTVLFFMKYHIMAPPYPLSFDSFPINHLHPDHHTL
jgi:hypothetical protein